MFEPPLTRRQRDLRLTEEDLRHALKVRLPDAKNIRLPESDVAELATEFARQHDDPDEGFSQRSIEWRNSVRAEIRRRQADEDEADAIPF